MHRHRPHRISYALLRKFVLRIQVQGSSELRHRLDLPATEEVAVSSLQMDPGQMLSRHFARGQVINVLWNQSGRLFKFVESLVQILRLFEFEAACEGLAGGFQ